MSLGVALCGIAAFAVEPVAVWNGDFTTKAKGGYTLAENGNTVAENGRSIAISGSLGVKVDRSSSLASGTGMTAIYKCTGLVVGSTVKTLATSSAANGNGNDRSGVNIQANGQTSGIWANTSTYNTSATQTTVTTPAGELLVAFVYGPNISGEKGGTTLYLKDGASDYVKAYACAGLKGSSDVVWGMCLGGTRANASAFPSAANLTITAVAMFDQALTQAEIAGYTFTDPPKEITAEGEISVSAINAQIDATDDKAIVTLPDGAEVSYDAALKVPTQFVCAGAIRLSSPTMPDLVNADFTGVTGGVLRSWLAKGIGFNFSNNNGGSTSVALAQTSWKFDAAGENGSAVAMTEDGISKITWTSKNLWTDKQSSGNIVHGYLDDGNGVRITVTNVPFEEYAVIIYATTDEAGKRLSFKKVNGTNYTYDESNSDVAAIGDDPWGLAQSSAEVAYGRNALRIVALTGPTLTIESYRDDSKSVRGCISAIQIVPYVTKVAPTVGLAADAIAVETPADYCGGTVTVSLGTVDAGTCEVDQLGYKLVFAGVSDPVAGSIKGSVVTFDLAKETFVAGNVYRGELILVYPDGEIALSPVTVYEGDRQYQVDAQWVDERADNFWKTGVWTDGVAVQGAALVVDEAAGATFRPNVDPDYVARCDSVFTVSLAAAEAVDAAQDSAVPEGVQGGVRLVKYSASQVKLQFLCSETGWDDGVAPGDAPFVYALDASVVVKVEFHYQKHADESPDYVKYSVGDNFERSVTSWSQVKKVSEVLVSDGTRLDFLKGVCELEKAVVIDVEILPGEEKGYDSEAAAEAAAAKLVVGVSEAVARALATDAQQAVYRSYFKVVVRPDAGGAGYHAEVAFTEAAAREIEEELAEAVKSVVAGFSSEDGLSDSFTGKPGLYYGVLRGDEVGTIDTPEERVLAGADGKVRIVVTKPEGKTQQFYRVICSPTPVK